MERKRGIFDAEGFDVSIQTGCLEDWRLGVLGPVEILALASIEGMKLGGC